MDTFTLLGQTFEIRHFPVLYKHFQSNPQTLETRIQSIADTWHEGDIVAAAQALESDLGKL